MSDRGSVTAELVLLTPALVALVLLVVIAGRTGMAHEQVRHAADQGARAASLVSGPAMSSAAETAVDAAFSSEGVTCARESTSVSSRMSGQHRTVTVEVTCTIGREGLALLGVVPFTVTARSTEVVDRYRGGA